MSFENPIIHSTYQKPWDRSYEWKSGKHKKTLEDGTIAQVIEGEIRSYNTETKSTDVFPGTMKLAVVGVTTCIGGYHYVAKGSPQNTRFWSNEVLNTFDEPMKVFRKSEAKGTEKVFEDLYKNFKDNRPQGMELQINLYFYNFKSKKVDRLTLRGCSRNAWFAAKMNNRELYEKFVIIEPGEMQTTGSVDFVPPKYNWGSTYTAEERAEIIQSESYKQYAQWEKNLANGLAESTGIDQTPPSYEDEYNQETGEVIEEDAPVDLDSIPF